MGRKRLLRKKIVCPTCGNEFEVKVTENRIYCSLGCRRHTEEWKQKRSEQMKGRKFSQAHREALRQSKLGDLNPSKRSEVRRKISENKKGVPLNHKLNCQCCVCRAKRGECKGYWCGKKLSEQHKKQISQSHVGIPSWRKGTTNEEYFGHARSVLIKENNRISHLGLKHSLRTKEKNRQKTRELWRDPKFVAKQRESRNVHPNKMEKCLDAYLQEWFPNQWDFVGDWAITIAGKCPDFVHTERKLLIELFGDYWHSQAVTGIPEEQHERERIQLFEDVGYRCLVVWEHKLKNLKKLKEQITNFIGRQ